MSPADKLLARHRALLTLMAAEARRCAVETLPASLETVTQARWAVARALMEQITFEEAYVLAPLEASTDPTMLAQARTIRDKQTAFTEVMFAHARRWPADAVRRDWPGFRQAMAEAHRLIAEQLNWEKRVVLPAMIALGGASGAPNRNWARDVWAVKDAFVGT